MNFENQVFLTIISKIIDGFWCLRCLNDRIKVTDMIVSFSNGATTFLVAKNGTKALSQLFEDGFWCSRCLNIFINLPDMIGSFVSGAMASLVAKNGTKQLSQLFEKCSRCLNDHIKVPEIMRSLPGGSTTPLVVKSETKQTLWKVELNQQNHLLNHHQWTDFCVWGV